MIALRRIPPHLAIAAVLAAMVVAVYWRVGSFPFINYDDEAYIHRNPELQAGLTPEGIRWALTTVMDAGWIPLTWLSRLLDVSLFGMDAGWHHLVNVLFHLFNTLLLFRVLRDATGKTWESGLAAALFAVHPLHVESVAWVTERKDVLAAFFFLLSLRAYVRYAARPGRARYGAVVLFFVLGLLSKAIVVTLPFVLLLLDFWPLGRFRPTTERAGGPSLRFHPSRPGRLVLEKVPLFLLSAAASVVTYLAQKEIEAVVPLGVSPLWARAGNAFLSYAAYLRRAAWPSDLAVFYPHPGTILDPWKAAASGMFLCLATAWVVRQALHRRWLAVGWFWYLGMLVPVIGLVQVGGNAMADRCAYLPLIGVYMMIAWGTGEMAARWRVPGIAAGAAAGGWILALAACAWVQVGYWESTSTLFRRALEVTEGNWLAHGTLGEVAQEAGRYEEAVVHYRAALRAWPDMPEVHNSLGKALDRLGRTDEAIGNLREELRLRPGFAEAHYNLGVIYNRIGDTGKATDHYREALRLRPDTAEAHNNLGVFLADVGRDGEAVAHFREALRLLPGYAEAHYNLGRALSRQGKIDEATVHLREAVRLRPDYPEAHNSLGAHLARLGAFPEALSQFRETLRLKPDHAGARANLERVLHEIGNARE